MIFQAASRSPRSLEAYVQRYRLFYQLHLPRGFCSASRSYISRHHCRPVCLHILGREVLPLVFNYQLTKLPSYQLPPLTNSTFPRLCLSLVAAED